MMEWAEITHCYCILYCSGLHQHSRESLFGDLFSGGFLPNVGEVFHFGPSSLPSKSERKRERVTKRVNRRREEEVRFQQWLHCSLQTIPPLLLPPISSQTGSLSQAYLLYRLFLTLPFVALLFCVSRGDPLHERATWRLYRTGLPRLLSWPGLMCLYILSISLLSGNSSNRSCAFPSPMLNAEI